MKINYMKRGALLFGAAALATSGMMAQEWSDVTSKYLQNPAFIPYWAGALTATADGVAETYNGAFELHQVINNLPEGEYTLTVNAAYRCATNDRSKTMMADGANHNAYIFLGDAKQTVEGMLDNYALPNWDGGESFVAGVNAPNNTGEANAAFGAGQYLNTVKYSHKGGDLMLGIANTGGDFDEWCVFDNFKLVGPDGEVAIPNGDFAEGLNADKAQTIWDCANVQGSQKSPDVNKAGGVYRKTNASPYNFGQRVTLPAGKYRFSVQSFLRYGGAGNVAGKFITCKQAWAWVEETSAVDRHENGTEEESDNAYVYVTSGWDTDENDQICKPASSEYALDPDFGNANGFYTEKAIKCLFDEDLDVYPDNEPSTEEVAEGKHGWCDSGYEREAAACFVANPDLYRNYVEFELAEETPVYVGMKKDVNGPKEYWNPFRDFKLEVAVSGSSAVNGIEVEEAEAPAEYYNLQGIRVAEPTNGIFIVKKGNKSTKQVFKN